MQKIAINDTVKIVGRILSGFSELKRNCGGQSYLSYRRLKLEKNVDFNFQERKINFMWRGCLKKLFMGISEKS